MAPRWERGPTSNTYRAEIGDQVYLMRLRSQDIQEIPVGIECQVRDCQQPGHERHHWAPRELFGAEADDWPMGLLCSAHHRLWHALIRQGRKGDD